MTQSKSLTSSSHASSENDELSPLSDRTVRHAARIGVLIEASSGASGPVAGYRTSARAGQTLRVRFGGGPAFGSPRSVALASLVIMIAGALLVVPNWGSALATLFLALAAGVAILVRLFTTELMFSAGAVQIRRGRTPATWDLTLSVPELEGFAVEHRRAGLQSRHRLTLRLVDGGAFMLREFSSDEVPNLVAKVGNQGLRQRRR